MNDVDAAQGQSVNYFSRVRLNLRIKSLKYHSHHSFFDYIVRQQKAYSIYFLLQISSSRKTKKKTKINGTKGINGMRNWVWRVCRKWEKHREYTTYGAKFIRLMFGFSNWAKNIFRKKMSHSSNKSNPFPNIQNTMFRLFSLNEITFEKCSPTTNLPVAFEFANRVSMTKKIGLCKCLRRQQTQRKQMFSGPLCG